MKPASRIRAIRVMMDGHGHPLLATNSGNGGRTRVQRVTEELEPIMIIFLAVIVGSIVIAMFLPLIAMISNLSGEGDSGGKKGE